MKKKIKEKSKKNIISNSEIDRSFFERKRKPREIIVKDEPKKKR